MARRKRKLSDTANDGPATKKSKLSTHLQPNTAATQDEISELVTLYNIWNLHSKMYAYENGWYHELVHDQKVLQKPEQEIIQSIHHQNWFNVLFMSSTDYSSKFFYSQITTVDAIKAYIRSIIDIIAQHAVSPDKQERTDKFCFDGNIISVFPCKTVKSGDVCIGFKLLDKDLAFKIGLRLSDCKESIVPFASYLDPNIEGTKSMNMHELCLVNTSIQKLSNLLFDSMDKYQSIREFRRDSKSSFQTRFVNKLKKRLHKYTGNVPSMIISVKELEFRPSIESHTEELLRVSFVDFESEIEKIQKSEKEIESANNVDSIAKRRLKRSVR